MPTTADDPIWQSLMHDRLMAALRDLDTTSDETMRLLTKLELYLSYEVRPHSWEVI